MAERIRVRLVPKNKEGESFTLHLPAVTPAVAKRFDADAGRAHAAHAAAFSMGIETTLSQRNTLEGFVPVDAVESVFGTKLKTEMRALHEYSDRGKGTEKYTVPEKELAVPKNLAETVAFAYVPMRAASQFSTPKPLMRRNWPQGWPHLVPPLPVWFLPTPGWGGVSATPPHERRYCPFNSR